jgi:hypothetical protein
VASVFSDGFKREDIFLLSSDKYGRESVAI